MVLAVFQRTIVNTSGDVLGAASVEVRREDTGALAPLFSDRAGTAGISNPATADADGFLRFYAAAGSYRIKATSGAFSRTWRHVPLPVVRDDGVPVLDIVSVKDHGADGDGVTDDGTAIAAAITAAQAKGGVLFWPAGTYLTSASIANLHAVRHMGPGVIQRGSDSFAVEPVDSSSNTIYVAATGGADTNDGLSSSEPLATIQAALNTLLNYVPVLKGNWAVDLAAGTYTEHGIAVPNAMFANNRLVIKGPDVSGGVPVAIIDGTGATAVGLTVAGQNHAEIRDIKIANFGALSATQVARLSDVRYENVHIDGALHGIDISGCSIFRINGGIIENCSRAGVISRSSTGSVGLVGVVPGPTIQDCVTGVQIGEQSNCHVDDLTIQDCANGLVTSDFGRPTLNGTVNFKRNGVAILGAQSGEVDLQGTINFHDGTADANTVNQRYLGFSGSGNGGKLQTSPALRADKIDAAFASHTGDTLETTLKTYTDLVQSNTFVFAGRSLKASILTRKTGAGGAATIRVKIGGNTISTYTLPATAATAVADIFLAARGAALQRRYQRVIDANGVVDVSFASQSFTMDDTVGDLDLVITAQLASATDTIEILSVEVYETG